MSIYLDVLVGINVIVSYFLLLLTFNITSSQYKAWRILISSIIGGIFSIYIFFPINSTILDLTVKFIMSVIMILTVGGFKNIKHFLRNIVVLFAVSFLYAGGMLAVWSIFRWNTILINNSTVYLDISPFLLISFSAVFYFVLVLVKSFLKKKALFANRSNVKLEFNGKTKEYIGIFDTGNSVKDLFSNSSVIFISENELLKFLNDEPKNFQSNYRLLPCSTVTGSKLLEAIRIDKARVIVEGKEIVLYKPILAISKVLIDKEYSLILNPEILSNVEEDYVKFENTKKSL